VLYLLFNAALLRAVPVADMRGAANVAQAAAQSVFGCAGAGIVSAVIVVCILGALNATIMVGPRVAYAMAHDGLFLPALGRVHARFRVPQAAIIVQGVWTCLIVLTGTFAGILIYSVFATLVLSIATGAAVIVLRLRKPHLARPYRTWGYPVVPLLYCLGTAGIALNALVASPRQSAWSFAAVAAGTLLYAAWRARPAEAADGLPR
jgi:APA family basic amino acid/polyamine antiporter